MVKIIIVLVRIGHRSLPFAVVRIAVFGFAIDDGGRGNELLLRSIDGQSRMRMRKRRR
jgi:hypothetical protein